MLKYLITIALTFTSSITIAQLPTYENVFGRIIYVGGGSSVHYYMKVISIKPYDRNKIEVGYLTQHQNIREAGISFASDDDPFSAVVHYAMLNCKNKTYSPYEDTNTGMKIYYNGGSRKWGDYVGGIESVGSINSEGVEEEITDLFEDACILSESF